MAVQSRSAVALARGSVVAWASLRAVQVGHKVGGLHVVRRTAASLTRTATIHAPNGYPFVVETFVTYAIADDGLRVEHRLHNLSVTAAPVAVGSHTYCSLT